MPENRVLLVNPPLVDGVPFTRTGRCQEREGVLGTTKPPFTLAVIAALYREAGVAFQLFDQTAERLSTRRLIRRLEESGFCPSLILFGSSFPTFDADVREMLLLKQRFASAAFCFGPPASCAPQQSLLRAPALDGVIVGEPEQAALALAKANGAADMNHVIELGLQVDRGLALPQARGSFNNFSEMPVPAWDLLNFKQHRLPLVDEPYLMVETSRGCPYWCDFCVAPIQQGHRFRARPASRVVAEIEHGYRSWGVRFFYLWADTATLDQEAYRELCHELIAAKLPIRWFANARVENLGDMDFVRLLRQSGCWMLSLGVETESHDLRAGMRKKMDRENIMRAVRTLREADILSFAFYILGYPGDTPQGMERTIQFAIDLDSDFANFYPAVPYPGTGLYEKCRDQGYLTSSDWSRLEYSYYVLRTPELDERTVMSAIRSANRRFYFRRRQIPRLIRGLSQTVLRRPGLLLQAMRRCWG